MKKIYRIPQLIECTHCGQEFDSENYSEHVNNDYSCDVFDPIYFEMQDADYLKEGD